jgi:hypothetical protein
MIFFSQFKKKNVEFMGSRLKLDLIFGEGWGGGWPTGPSSPWVNENQLGGGGWNQTQF